MTSTCRVDVTPDIEEIDADDAWNIKITHRSAGNLLALELDCSPEFGNKFIAEHVKAKPPKWKKWVKGDKEKGTMGHWEKIPI